MTLYSIDQSVYCETIIRKSRFLAFLEPADDIAQYDRRLAELHARFPDASHVCSACVTGGDAQSLQRCDDDGEPAGTAGKPILNVLLHNDLQNVACFVVRYFGGIRLGAGGLVRAYGGAASAALQLGNRVPLIRVTRLQVDCDFSQEHAVRNLLARYTTSEPLVSWQSGQQTDQPAGVRLRFEVPESHREALQAEILALSRGEARICADEQPLPSNPEVG